jgi:LmbE family N-acetylglucosaminyl deacetylase
MHKGWGGNDHPFHMRSLEDRAVAARLGIAYRWLGFHDLIYRYANLFDVSQIFAPGFDIYSDSVFVRVCEALADLLSEFPNATIFAPLGVGSHRDHLVVHEAICEMQRAGACTQSVYFYEDFPYAAKTDVKTKLNQGGSALRPVIVDITETLADRVALTKLYTSQVKPLFGDDENVEKAIMSYANQVGSRARPAERFWTAQD